MTMPLFALEPAWLRDNAPTRRPESTSCSSTPECPGPECAYCSGEACRLCGAGVTHWPVDVGMPACDHDSAERHEDRE